MESHVSHACSIQSSNRSDTLQGVYSNEDEGEIQMGVSAPWKEVGEDGDPGPPS